MSTKMNIEGHKKADSQKGHSRQKDMSKTQRAKKQRPSVPPSGSKIASHKENQPKKLKKLKQKKSKAEILVTGGILAATSAITVSLFVYFRPFSGQDVIWAAKSLYSYTTERIADTADWLGDMTDRVAGQLSNIADQITKLTKSDTSPTESLVSETSDNLSLSESDNSETKQEFSSMERTSQLGDISNMTAEPVFPAQEAIYTCMLDTAAGPLFYYNQGDLRWKDYLYGGADRIAKYGCGPVCVAMIINSLTPNPVSPIEMADWSAENGCYAPQGGSYHNLIPKSLTAFGLEVESVTERTAEHVRELLNTGHILVALMGKGTLTQNGHFIIIVQICDNGNVYIADPASYGNSTKEWDLQLLIDELKRSYDSGGPLWAVRRGEVNPS